MDQYCKPKTYSGQTTILMKEFNANESNKLRATYVNESETTNVQLSSAYD